jgi:hypothetical protein
MPLPDLLQWLGSGQKTGTLQIERKRAVKTIRLREGHVVGCSSDDPAHRLGQFLISRKRINEDQLRQGLQIMEQTSQQLGQTLVEMGALSQEQVLGELKAQAEEIIYGLFDWSDGVFRFEETVDDRLDVFPIDLQVDDVLLRGLNRFDEMTAVREVFYDPNIVLRYTSKPPGPEIFGDETSRSMYSAIDGERTLADILLHVHGTEYRVTRFLYELHGSGYVEIAGVKQTETSAAESTAESAVDENDETPADLEPGIDEPAMAAVDLELDTDLLASVRSATPPADATATAAAVEAPATASPTGTGPSTGDLAKARELMTSGSLEKALDVLDLLYRENPGDDALRRLTAEAEAAFVDQCYGQALPADKIPILTCPLESLASESLTSEEYFLLSRIDGTWNIKSIIQVAPFREVEALRTLKRMCESGTIELHDAV